MGASETKETRGTDKFKTLSQKNVESNSTLQSSPDSITKLDGSSANYTNFSSFYDHVQKTLKENNFKFTDPSDLVTFERKVSMCNDMHIDIAQVWVEAYLDYAILAAWALKSGQKMVLYPPYAIQQVGRLHSVYTVSFFSFCKIIMQNKQMIPFSPIKIVARQSAQDLEKCREGYNKAKEMLWKNLYENPKYSQFQQKMNIFEAIWAPFEVNFVRSECSFIFLKNEHSHEFANLLVQNRDKILLNLITSSEIIRVSKNLRSILGVGDLIDNLSAVAYPPISSTFVTSLQSFEEETATKIDGMAFTPDFVNVLAWENRLTIDEAYAWILEYKKFLFLILAFNGKIMRSPSEIVDQVWHLHMQFVESYQADVCKIMVINHFPSKGGKVETKKYTNMYAETLEAYDKYFGTPNSKIWPSSDARFSEFGVSLGYRLFFLKEVKTEDLKVKKI